MSFSNIMNVNFKRDEIKSFTLNFSTFASKSIEAYNIPEGVTKIRDKCFKSCSGLASITIPNTVKTIGQYAFSDVCLTEVTIPPSVETIESNAFYEAWALTKINFSEGLKTIKTMAFYDCPVTEIHLPESLETIEASAFQGIGGDNPVCVYIGANTKIIGKNAFNANVLKFVINQNPWASLTGIPWGAWSDETPITWLGTNQTLSKVLNENNNEVWATVVDPKPEWVG